MSIITVIWGNNGEFPCFYTISPLFGNKRGIITNIPLLSSFGGYIPTNSTISGVFGVITVVLAQKKE